MGVLVLFFDMEGKEQFKLVVWKNGWGAGSCFDVAIDVLVLGEAGLVW